MKLASPSTISETVSASPTKRFFIAVLIKDIQFLDAVIELVDNSVDAAKAYAAGPTLAGQRITVTFSERHFSIEDNAGGISINQAKNYAFRFGRASDAPKSPGSVGEFGVGMKRALFKIGRNFTVKSMTSSESFTVSVDVDAWEAESSEPDGWTFPMTSQGKNPTPSKTGTSIEVTNLYPYATDDMASSNFGTRLSERLKGAHAEALGRGLEIIVGKASLHAQIATLLQSNELAPIKYEQDLEISGKGVKVTIIAGVGEQTLADAGWYIFCNGRQIERAEQSERTGWQMAVIEGEKKAPKAHWQFARFRGYVFFESKDADVLPWNTTKTGLDVEAPAYRRIRVDMANAMREIITFLNTLDAESSDGARRIAVKTASSVPLVNLQGGRNFIFKETTRIAAPPKPIRITIDCAPDDYETLRQHMSATSKKAVGEELLNYYWQGEGLDA